MSFAPEHMHDVPAGASGTVGAENLRFGVATFLWVLVTHAVAFLAHEYAHSFMAWGLGWMADPLALDYGDLTVYNVIFLGEVEDNVRYDAIFASGHGLHGTLIALAGIGIGNGVLYGLLYRLARTRRVAGSRLGLSFVYWLSLMCAGNVWSYVPIRAITTHADIALAARGLGVSTGVLFPLLIVPALAMLYHFFCRMFPLCCPKVSAGSPNNLFLMMTMTAFWYFSFFGGDGTDGSYGLVSQMLSIISRYLLFPVAAMWLASRYLPAPKNDQKNAPIAFATGALRAADAAGRDYFR